MEPRKIVGTVDTSEFVVAFAASIGFLLTLSFAEIPWSVVGALLVGGIIAAPIAAYVVRILPMGILGTAVGGVILITNMRTFLGAIGIEGAVDFVAYALIVAVWLAALAHSIIGEPPGEANGGGGPAGLEGPPARANAGPVCGPAPPHRGRPEEALPKAPRRGGQRRRPRRSSGWQPRRR